MKEKVTVVWRNIIGPLIVALTIFISVILFAAMLAGIPALEEAYFNMLTRAAQEGVEQISDEPEIAIIRDLSKILQLLQENGVDLYPKEHEIPRDTPTEGESAEIKIGTIRFDGMPIEMFPDECSQFVDDDARPIVTQDELEDGRSCITWIFHSRQPRRNLCFITLCK